MLRPLRSGRRLPWTPLPAARLAIVADRWKHRLRRMAVKGALGAAGVVFVIAAVLFLFLAAYHWLSGQIGPVAAAASVGGALLVVGLLALAVALRSGSAEAAIVDEVAEPARSAPCQARCGTRQSPQRRSCANRWSAPPAWRCLPES